MVELARCSLRYPILAWGCAAIVTGLMALGLPRLETDVGYRAFLGPDHSAVAQLDRFADQFVGGIPIAAVWSCRESAPCDHVFDPNSLAMAHSVAAALARVPGVQRVDGPATTPLLAPQTIGLPRLRRLAPDGKPAPDIDALAARAVRDSLWVGQIVSADATSGAVLAHLESSSGDVAKRVVAALQEALAPFEAQGFRFHLVGGPIEFVVAGAELQAAAARVVPLMVGLVALVIFLLFRAWIVAVLCLGVVGLGVLWTFGLLGWLGWAQNSLTQALAPLVLVIGVCDAIHVLSAYALHPRLASAATRTQREQILLQACGEVGPACAMTTLTTAAGFGSFAASGLESIARFGLAAAFGVAVALLLCFALLPSLLVRVPPTRLRRLRDARAWPRVLASQARLRSRAGGWVLGIAAAIAIVSAVGLHRLRVDASFEDLYGRNSQVVRWAEFVAKNLREPDTLELVLNPPDGVALSSPSVLATVTRLQDGLSAIEGLGPSISILSPTRTLNRLLYRAELDLNSAGAAARTAALFRFMRAEEPGGFALFVDERRGGLRVSVTSAKPPQDRLRQLLAEVDSLIGSQLPSGWTAQVTGPLQVVGVMVDEIRQTQLVSFAVASVIVFAFLVLFFRSIRFAVMALVPTFFPVGVTLGFMGLAGIALDVGGAMVGTVVLGLAVDDAIHLLVQYRRARSDGMAPDRSIERAVQQVGHALVTTSAALTLGFLALVFAPWKSVANFGLIAGLAILCALASALFLLPAVLVALEPRREVEPVSSPSRIARDSKSKSGADSRGRRRF